MAALQRVTTEFIELEDRMRVAGENERGEVTSFWLTQRLLVRLVKHLIDSLEKNTPEGQKLAAHDERISEMVQEMAQQAAQAELGNEAPVKDPESDRAWLAHEVDITQTEQHIQLRFRSRGARHADVALEISQLRQWLSILYRLWVQAEWSTAIWPHWMIESFPAEKSGSKSPVH